MSTPIMKKRSAPKKLEPTATAPRVVGPTLPDITVAIKFMPTVASWPPITGSAKRVVRLSSLRNGCDMFAGGRISVAQD